MKEGSSIIKGVPKRINPVMVAGLFIGFAAFPSPAQTYVGGLVNGQVWSAANSPYLATNDVIVQNLTIQPGVTVQFMGNNQFNVPGFLQAGGTRTNQITFRGTNSASWQGIVFSGASNNCLFQYCIVQNANNSGIQFRGTPMTIQGCTISGNFSPGSGGGIYTDGSLTLQSCLVSGNSSSSPSSHGGGIYSSGGGGAVLTLQQCVVSNNNVSAVDARGGGIGCDGGTLILSGSRIVNNSANGNQCSDSFCHNYASGGGVYVAGPVQGQTATISGNSVSSGDRSSGAGIYCGPLTLTNSDVSNNSGYSSYGGSYGGGAYCGSPLILQSCRISGNSVNFVGCCAGPTYGAAAINCSDSAFDLIQNCVISGNSAGNANGIAFYPAIIFGGASGTASILNNVFYGNFNHPNNQVIQGGAGTIENSIFYGNDVGPTSMNVNYSMVPGGYGGTNNIDANIPINQIFTDTTYFFLANSSPCIDAGDPDPALNDVLFPPSKGGVRNDMGAYGGPGANQNLIFVPPLTIAPQPLSQNVNFGSTVQLFVGVTGADGPVSYQWQFNGTNIAGATSSTLTLTNFSLGNVGAYSVVVSDLARSVASNPAFINVAALTIKMYAGVTLNGNVGSAYLLQSAPTFGVGSVWTDLTNITLPSSSYVYIDYRSPTNTAQFYRLVPQ
ncbi:MAG: hypothetical protein C5B50_14335 [Verrucomicrobia bacterium]|nr:MAG: hypothetical protein C5B50_14335 [Verrucomicrobiota bacterium]